MKIALICVALFALAVGLIFVLAAAKPRGMTEHSLSSAVRLGWGR
jgi:hypothetical protein